MTTTTTTTSKLPAYATPADVVAVRNALVPKRGKTLSTDDLLVMLGQSVEAGRQSAARFAATVKATVRETTERYEQMGAIVAALFRLNGRDGTVPASNHEMSVADAKAMFDHLKVDLQASFGMSPALLQVCVNAYQAGASAAFPAWSDLRSDDRTEDARKAAPSFYANDAQAVIRWAVARKGGRVVEGGHVLERGNRANGAEAERRRLADVKLTRDENARLALADAVKVLTTKRSNSTIGLGPDVTVGTVNGWDEDALKRLSLFITARREVIKASAPKHDAGKAGATVKASRKVKASTK